MRSAIQFFRLQIFVFLLCCSFLSTAFADLDCPHNVTTSIGCESCHDVTSSAPLLMPSEFAHDPQADIDDTLLNSLCWSCHNDPISPHYVQTHSSLQTSDNYGDWAVECTVCHGQHSQKQRRTYGASSYLYSGLITGAVTESTITQTGAGWANGQYAGYIVVPNVAKTNFSYKILSNTSDTLTVQGPMDLAQVNAGDTFAVIYGKLIRDVVFLDKITDDPPGSKTGDMTVKFFRPTGLNSFADGDTEYDGICEVCHTKTKHFRNDGTGSDQNHGGKEQTNCMVCHSHMNGFAHSCGEGFMCHGTQQSHLTHTKDDEPKGPNIVCEACHDTSDYPNFKSGTGTVPYDLSETDVCDTCHSSGGGYDGVTIAKANWTTGIYEPEGKTLRSGNEKWCATCHDTMPANSKQDGSGVDAPNVIGDEDAGLAEGYRYGTGYGFYKTGHGLAGGTYPASGGPAANAACTDCHDVTQTHIDHDSRTYAAADKNYQAGYRLAYSMDIPRKDTGFPISDFELCAQCHDIDPFIQKTNLTSNLRNIQVNGTSTDLSETVLTDSTRSWGVNEFLYDGTVLIPNIEKPWNVYTITSNTETTITVSGSMLADGASTGNYRVVCNGHRYHLTMGPVGPMSPGSPNWDSDWSATSGGDMQLDSGISCTTCHNVHGSKYGRMVRDGELISKIYDRKPGLDFYYVDSGDSYAGPTVLSESIGGHWSNGSRMCTNCHGSPDARFYRAAKGTVSLSSASNQYFSVGDAATEISTITIIDNAQAGSLNTAGDIRIRIPDSLNMTWDTSDTSAVMGGTASGKVNTTVSFPDSKILLIDVTSDFSASDTLTVTGLNFTNFTNLSSSDNLELYVEGGLSLCTVDTKTIQVATKAIISSNADQTFAVDDWPTPISPITVMAITNDAEINSTDDLRIKIPSTFAMFWDTTDTSAIIGGTASSKVDDTVSFPDEKTLLIDVTDNFDEGDTVTISDLKFDNFFAASAADNLELYLDGASDITAEGLNDKTIMIESRSWMSPVDIVADQCSDEMSGYDTLIDNDLATGNLWAGGYGIFDLGKEYLVTHIRIYAQINKAWHVLVGNTPSGCLSDGTDVTGKWRIGQDGARWYERTVTQTSGRYLKLQYDDVGGWPANNTLMEIEFFGIPLDALTMSSAADQEFDVGQAGTAISQITITESATSPTISATNDIRIVIPSSLNMSWDTSDISATVGGTASAKVNTTVSYPDQRTLLIDVTQDFEGGDTLTVENLNFKDFWGQSDAANLQLSTDGGLSVATTDPKTVRIWDWITPVDVLDAAPDCCDLNGADFLIDNNTATGNTPWTGGYALLDMGDTYTVTAIRIYKNSGVYQFWDISIGDDTTDCTLNSYATMVKNEWYVPVDNEWYSTEIDPPVSGRYIRIDKDAGGGLNDKGLREIDFQGYKTVESRTLRLASAADQTFVKDQASTAIQTIAIVYYPSNETITAANDIRINIPAGFNMTWDTTDTTATIGGSAAAKVGGTVSYPDNKTLVIDVTSDFAAGDSLSVSDLSFTNFSDQSSKNHLQLSIDGGTSPAATDSKYLWVIP